MIKTSKKFVLKIFLIAANAAASSQSLNGGGLGGGFGGSGKLQIV